MHTFSFTELFFQRRSNVRVNRVMAKKKAEKTHARASLSDYVFLGVLANLWFLVVSGDQRRSAAISGTLTQQSSKIIIAMAAIEPVNKAPVKGIR